MANNTSQHILNTSATLLGFCLVVITSLHISNQVETLLLDELTSIIAILLTFSTIFSFLSIKTSNMKKEQLLESIADYLFFISLVGILLVILLISLNFIE